MVRESVHLTFLEGWSLVRESFHVYWRGGDVVRESVHFILRGWGVVFSCHLEGRVCG